MSIKCQYCHAKQVHTRLPPTLAVAGGAFAVIARFMYCVCLDRNIAHPFSNST